MCQRHKKLPLNTVVHDFIPQIMLKRLEAGSEGWCVEEKGGILIFPAACEHGSVWLNCPECVRFFLVHTGLVVMHVCITGVSRDGLTSKTI